MSLRKKKKVEEEIKQEEEIAEVPVEEEIIEGEPVGEEPVEEAEEKVEEPVSSEIRVGSKVRVIRPTDYEGRPLDIDTAKIFVVYAIEGDRVQLRTARGNIFFVKLANLKKVD